MDCNKLNGCNVAVVTPREFLKARFSQTRIWSIFCKQQLTNKVVKKLFSVRVALFPPHSPILPLISLSGSQASLILNCLLAVLWYRIIAIFPWLYRIRCIQTPFYRVTYSFYAIIPYSNKDKYPYYSSCTTLLDYVDTKYVKKLLLFSSLSYQTDMVYLVYLQRKKNLKMLLHGVSGNTPAYPRF